MACELTDQEWAKEFLAQEGKLDALNELSLEHYELQDNLADQWTEMNQETRNVVTRLRAQA